MDTELMQIPTEMKKCVAFLACRRKSGYVNGGTVFFVAYPLPVNEGALAFYAVTARHVIEDINKRSDGNAHCRINTKQGGVEFVSIPISNWTFNDDPRVDVAVAPFPFDFNVCDHTCLPLSIFITPEVMSKNGVGSGDELFFPGLFAQRPGEKRNLPIVRIGSIAAMPEEPVETKWGVLPRAYLVEARSLGGLSGSPVFWNCGPIRMTAGPTFQMGSLAFYLLGLVHGHYEDKGNTWDADEATAIDGFNINSANMGIAIVVPASDILDTLNHPDLERHRSVLCQQIAALKRLSLPVPDAALIPTSLDKWFTQEDTTLRTETAGTLSTSESADTSSDKEKHPTPPVNP